MNATTRTSTLVPIDKIVNRTPKTSLRMTPGELKILADDVQARGLDNPVHVIKTNDGYEVDEGQHRIAAHELLKLTEVEAFVKEPKPDAERAMDTLMENLARKDLSPAQLGHQLAVCLEKKGLTQAALAERTGMSQAKISKHAALVKLPKDIQDLVGTHLHIDVASYLQPLTDHVELTTRVAKRLKDGKDNTLRTCIKYAAGEDPIIGCDAFDVYSFVRVALRGKYDWEMPERVANDAQYQKGIKALKTITFGTAGKDNHLELCLEPAKAAEAVRGAAQRIHNGLQKKAKKESLTDDPEGKPLTPEMVTPKRIQVDSRVKKHYLTTGKARTVQLITEHLAKQRTMPDDMELHAYTELGKHLFDAFRSKKDQEAWEAIVKSILPDKSVDANDIEGLFRSTWGFKKEFVSPSGRHDVRKLVAALRAFGTVCLTGGYGPHPGVPSDEHSLVATGYKADAIMADVTKAIKAQVAPKAAAPKTETKSAAKPKPKPSPKKAKTTTENPKTGKKVAKKEMKE